MKITAHEDCDGIERMLKGGQEYDLPPHIALYLVKMNLADKVGDVTERATVSAPETMETSKPTRSSGAKPSASND